MEESYQDFVKRLTKDLGHEMNLIHSALGVTSDGGEFADAIKAHAVYGKGLDLVNLVEEAGDVLFFLQMALNEFGLTIEDAQEVNQAKLGVRYVKGYNDADAKQRKRELEWEAMATVLGGKV